MKKAKNQTTEETVTINRIRKMSGLSIHTSDEFLKTSIEIRKASGIGYSTVITLDKEQAEWLVNNLSIMLKDL